MCSFRLPSYDRPESWRGGGWRDGGSSWSGGLKKAGAVLALGVAFAAGMAVRGPHHHSDSRNAPAAPAGSWTARVGHILKPVFKPDPFVPRAQEPSLPLDVPSDISAMLWKATNGDPTEYELAARIAWSESRFDPDPPYDESGGACGLMQILSRSTLPGLLRRHAADHGYAPDDIRAACVDPQMSATLGVEYMREIRVYLEQNLNRPLTFTDVKFGFLLGPEGGRRFLAAYDSGARDEPVSRVVSQDAITENYHVFYNSNDQMRTVGELHDMVAAYMTEKPLPNLTGNSGPRSILSLLP